MSWHRRLGPVVLVWVLLHAGHDGAWQHLGEFRASDTCERVRESDVAKDVLRAIGSALADQPADNPIRREAYERADRHVREQYRCEWQGS